MAEALAQFAPGGDDACAVEEAERERPDRAPGNLGVAVAVADAELALSADREYWGSTQAGGLRYPGFPRR